MSARQNHRWEMDRSVWTETCLRCGVRRVYEKTREPPPNRQAKLFIVVREYQTPERRLPLPKDPGCKSWNGVWHGTGPILRRGKGSRPRSRK